MSTSAMGVSEFSFEPPPSASFFSASFLFSEECCDIPFDFIENFESSEVLPVDSILGGLDDLPRLERLVDGEPSGTISITPLSREITLGRLLNWARCTTVVGLELRRAMESFLAVLEDIGETGEIGPRPLGVWDGVSESTTDAVEADSSIHRSEWHTEAGNELTTVGQRTKGKHKL
jgi:hypothetical protein